MLLISPDHYIEMNNEKSYKELLKVRHDLIKKIRKFEKCRWKHKLLMQEPSQETAYYHNLECLSRLCELIAEKYDFENNGI